MKYAGQKYPAIEPLSRLIEYVYTIAIPDHEEAQLFHIAPSLEKMIVFNFGSTYKCAVGNNATMEEVSNKVTIMGPVRQMFNCMLNPGCDLLVCCSINDGFYRLASSSNDCELIEELLVLWETLKGMPDDIDRIAILNEYLRTNVACSEPQVESLISSIPDIHNATLNPIDVIAAKSLVSARTVQLRFKKYAGYSSKELLRYLRFKQIIGWLIKNHEKEINWMDLVVRFRYHDQSHMIKDFKYFTGLSPKKVLALCKQENLCISRDFLDDQAIPSTLNEDGKHLHRESL